MLGCATARAAPPSSLAIVEAGIAQSEDAPFVARSYEFLPGDYLYFTFQVAGFAVLSERRGERRTISLEYQVVPQDNQGIPLTEAASGIIEAELTSEDKNWTPKRRVSFLLPSFVAGGDFHILVQLKDLIGKAEIRQEYRFRIGGLELQSTDLSVQNFEFFRSEEERKPLELAAYSAGDTVYVGFDMVGFKTDAHKQYHLSYGLTVLRPDGKPYLDAPGAADLEASSFYPAQYLPGVFQVKTSPTAMHGEYVVLLSVHDSVANKTCQIKRAFSIE